MQTGAGSRIGSIAAITGAIVLIVGTYLRPIYADPNVPLAAFAEYAASHYRVAIDLMQLIGFVLITASLVLLSRTMADGPAAEWARLGMVGAIASLVIASALQAVDGIALKMVIDTWAATAEPTSSSGALTIRQIEVSLASIGSVMFGLTATIYGVAILIDRRIPKWIGVVAIVGGIPTAIAGIVIALTGFSGAAMVVNMPSNVLLILWLIAMGIYGWKRAES